MKTLKKVLAVVLALAMVLGMTSMASAAFAGETINADYQEAVDVLNAIGVLTGKGDGKFDPQGTLTRAEGATIITKLLGQANFAGKAEYSDAANHWGSSAIAYVAYAGIADGIGANKFNPDGVLTGNAFAKWLAAAIGYNVKLEGMTGKTWEVGVAKVVKEAGLAKGIETFSASKAITREEAAQVAFNALQAELVTYNQSIDSNGVITYTKTSQTATYSASTKHTLITDNFEKLVKVAGTDANGNANHTWYYKGEKVGTYSDVAKAIATYDQAFGTETAMQSKIKADLAAYFKAGYLQFADANAVIVNGTPTANASYDEAAELENVISGGQRVEVYGTSKTTTAGIVNEITQITVTDEFVGSIKKINNNKSIVVNYYNASGVAAATTVKVPDANAEQAEKDYYNAIAALAKDDFFTFYGTAYDAPTKFVAACTKVSAAEYTKDDVNTYKNAAPLRVFGGEKYLTAKNYVVKTSTESYAELGKAANLLLNSKNEIIKATLVDNSIAYVYDVDYEGTLGARTYYAFVLYTDGTEGQVTLQDKNAFDDASHYIDTFVELVPNTKGFDVNTGVAQAKLDELQTLKANQTTAVKLDGTDHYMNSKSVVYLYDSATEKYVAYTYDTLPKTYVSKVDTSVAYLSSNDVKCIVVNDWENADNEVSYVFAYGAAKDTEYVKPNTFKEYDAIVDGDSANTVWADNTANMVASNGLYKVLATDDEGRVMADKAATAKNLSVVANAAVNIVFDEADAGAWTTAVKVSKYNPGPQVPDGTIAVEKITLDNYTLTIVGEYKNSSGHAFTDSNVKFMETAVSGTFTCYTYHGGELNEITLDSTGYTPTEGTLYYVVNGSGQIAWMVIVY